MQSNHIKTNRHRPIKHIVRPIDLEREMRRVRYFLHNSMDLQFRNIGDDIIIVFLSSVINMERLEQTVISPLRHYKNHDKRSGINNDKHSGINHSETQHSSRSLNFEVQIEQYISAAKLSYTKKWRTIAKELTHGYAAIFVKGERRVALVGLLNSEQRAVMEPESEKQIRGPREGFIENLETNVSLMRRRMNSPSLVFEKMNLGSLTETTVAISYIAGICDPEIIQEVRERLKLVHLRSVLDTGYLESFIVDHPKSIFSQVEITEKPDKALAQLMEGRVIIMVDGTPNVVIVPTIFLQYIQASEDYYVKPYYAATLRYIRMIAMVIALFLPGLYVALTTIHQEMLPTQLALGIAGARENVPFPAVVEAIMMEIAFEMLREAGLRMPAQVGQAVSIVGALIIGQAAVDAGIVSPLMVIVVAFSGISSFLIPAYELSISLRLLRFLILIISSVLGLFGITLVALILLIQLASMQSFGVPYFEPLVPINFHQFREWFFRKPWRAITKHPYNIAIDRMDNKVSPEEPPITEKGNYRR